MFYDPQAQDIKDFIAWLETKDPNETYDWEDSNNCACAQFYRSLGRGSNDKTWLMGKLDALAWGKLGAREWTFGKLLERARN